MSVKEALLPENLTMDRLHGLPEECGVYFFHNKKGRVIYVGKSINIRKRVMQHFSKVTEKANKLQQVYDISYELTGSELVALLYESQLIKQLAPSINRAQRTKYFPYMVYTFKNEQGYICFEVAKNVAANRKKFELVTEYPSAIRAKSGLKYIRATHELCAAYCGLDSNKKPCFNFHIKQCFGACIEAEPVEDYNDRAEIALKELNIVFKDDFFILDIGKTKDDHAVILIEDGQYKGYGYIDKEDLNGDNEVLRDTIRPYPSYPETSRILQHFLNDNSAIKIVKLPKKSKEII